MHDSRVAAFKDLTQGKVKDLRCPDHGQAPRVRFEGGTLRDIRIRMSACCDKLIQAANLKIADS
jgi:hypothetical protein